MQSESARMSSAAEARYRIDAPNSKPRSVKVIALDHPSERVVKELAAAQVEQRELLHRVGIRQHAQARARAFPAGSAISPAAPRT